MAAPGGAAIAIGRSFGAAAGRYKKGFDSTVLLFYKLNVEFVLAFGAGKGEVVKASLGTDFGHDNLSVKTGNFAFSPNPRSY